jgi:hypothetical protein
MVCVRSAQDEEFSCQGCTRHKRSGLDTTIGVLMVLVVRAYAARAGN